MNIEEIANDIRSALSEEQLLRLSSIGDSIRVRKIITDVLIAQGSEPKPQEVLLSKITEVENIFNSECDWEYKYDRIFGYAKHIRTLMDELSISFSYYDPDTSYEEDTRAYVQALLEVKENLLKETASPG